MRTVMIGPARSPSQTIDPNAPIINTRKLKTMLTADHAAPRVVTDGLSEADLLRALGEGLNGAGLFSVSLPDPAVLPFAGAVSFPLRGFASTGGDAATAAGPSPFLAPGRMAAFSAGRFWFPCPRSWNSGGDAPNPAGLPRSARGPASASFPGGFLFARPASGPLGADARASAWADALVLRRARLRAIGGSAN